MVKCECDIKMHNSEESFIDELSNKLVDVNDAKYNMQRVDIKFKLLRGTVIDINALLIISLLVVLIKYNALPIASALIQKTEIILFDEATSALDNETQTEIQKAINNMKGEYTILIIAHRLSTIINSDRIILLDDGKIIAEGSHKELLENCEKYKHLYESEIRK